MQIAFGSRELRTLCEDEARASEELGEVRARALKNRLADLRAAVVAPELPAGRPRRLDGADSNLIALDLADGWRLVFAANHKRNPITESGSVDWEKVSRVKILRIEEMNG